MISVDDPLNENKNIKYLKMPTMFCTPPTHDNDSNSFVKISSGTEPEGKAIGPQEDNKLQNNLITIIRTRGGHEIFFKGSSLGEELEIHTVSDHVILFNDSCDGRPEKIIIARNNSKDDNGFVVIDSEDNISISTRSDLKIKAENIEIQATKDMSLKSSSTITLNGSLIKLN